MPRTKAKLPRSKLCGHSDVIRMESGVTQRQGESKPELEQSLEITQVLCSSDRETETQRQPVTCQRHLTLPP